MSLSSVIESLKRWAQSRERSEVAEFTCGHCNRSESCGRAPTEDCVEKLEQIAQGDHWRQQRASHLGERRPLF